MDKRNDIPAHIPTHVGIIMDGNGRWAKKRGLPRTLGHKAGGEAFVKIVTECRKIGIKCLTVYAFSTENWKRSESEVTALMSLMKEYMVRYTDDLVKNGIRLRILGDLSRFESATVDEINKRIELSKNNDGMTLCIALNYGGRAELTTAVNKLLRSGKQEITEQDISDALYTASLPDPDLIIRTSGEQRTSNFLLWQSAYSEYYFTDVLWPDFDEKELRKAIEEYSKRNRRFGNS
ncbi:MAG: isoprenyl transferase [Clostridia bacterium]|nr:isoprenyl transferase [Clostridia bacterium]